MRILITLLIVLALSLLFTVKSDSSNLNSYSYQYLSFLNLYRYPMALIKNYLKYYLNLGTQSKTVTQIQTATVQYIQFIQSPQTIITLYDTNLNSPGLYYPFKNNSINKGIGYSQVDIFYVIADSISSLSLISSNRSSRDFIQIHEYLVPSYDTMINTTKYRLHSQFQNMLTAINLNQIVFTLIKVVLVLASTIFVSIEIGVYLTNMEQFLLSILELNTSDLNKILKYWDDADYYFKSM